MNPNSFLRQRGCPADVLLLMFEEVYVTAPATLRALRLASRQFNVLVIPLVYRHLKLNDALVKCFEVDDEPSVPTEDVDARRRVKSAICAFTRQITINKALKWASVVNLVLSLDKFHHLHWSFWEDYRPTRIPQSVLDSLAERWPAADFSVDNLASKLDIRDSLSSLPPTNLVSLRFQGVLRRRVNPAEHTLKNTLLKCDRLEILHLLDVQSGSRFMDEEIGQSERLPAVSEIYLQGYFWLHSPQTAISFWDWSRLTSLRLKKVFIVNFLETVLPENLLQLRSLITDGHCQSAVDHPKVSVFRFKFL